MNISIHCAVDYGITNLSLVIDAKLPSGTVLSHIDNKPYMSTEPSIVKEAERLFAKFGSQAAEVAKELRNIDSHSEHYFWTDVIAYLNDMRRSNAK